MEKFYKLGPSSSACPNDVSMNGWSNSIHCYKHCTVNVIGWQLHVKKLQKSHVHACVCVCV